MWKGRQPLKEKVFTSDIMFFINPVRGKEHPAWTDLPEPA